MMGDTFVKGADSVTLPPGKYWVGDPCYAFGDGANDDAAWDELLNSSDYFNGQCWGTFTKPDGTLGLVVAFSTMYGDGCYTDREGREYGVDAGLIGIVPIGDVEGAPDGMHLVEFHRPFQCFEHRGVIEIGNIIIDTDGDQEDDENGEWDW